MILVNILKFRPIALIPNLPDRLKPVVPIDTEQVGPGHQALQCKH